MVKMNGLHPPLTSADVPTCVTDKRTKATSAFALDDYDISLHLLISLYIVVGNSGTILAPKHQKLL